jgi:beta-galactosidase
VTLEILLYTIARVNFGVEIHDRKGLHGPVRFNGQPLENWEIRAIDFDADGVLPPLTWKTGRTQGAAFWRGGFDVAQPAIPSSTCPAGDRASSGSTAVASGATGVSARRRPCTCPARGCNKAATKSWCWTWPAPHSARIAGLKMPILDKLHPELDLASSTEQSEACAGRRSQCTKANSHAAPQCRT